MTICIPTGTDWSCAGWTADALATMREDEAEALLLDKSEAFAWSLLASLTAYRIGTCPITVRPCATRCAPTGALSLNGHWPLTTIGQFYPYISGGAWYNACLHSSGSCECTELSEVILPGPVGAITEIMLNGEELPRSAYRVDNGSRLVRLDGEKWPACNDGTFTVTYYRGAAPNIMTRAAAGALAYEFYKGCKGEECRLPNNVISATGNGLSYDMEALDVTEGASIPEVMAVVRIYNPHGLKSAPAVASPDAYMTRMTTWS